MFDETEERPHPDDHSPEATQDLINLSEQAGPVADPRPSQEDIAKMAHHLWELRQNNPAQANLTAEDDWRRAEAILSGDAGMGQLPEHDPSTIA